MAGSPHTGERGPAATAEGPIRSAGITPGPTQNPTHAGDGEPLPDADDVQEEQG